MVFNERPLLGPLLFENNASDARDHAANERSRFEYSHWRSLYNGLADLDIAFLSWLRLSVYMAIVSVAIVMSFHLKTEPSDTGMCTLYSSLSLLYLCR